MARTYRKRSGRAARVPPAGLVVYDADCGFCTASVRLAQRRVNPRAHYVPWQSLDLASVALRAEETAEAAWWIGPGGRAERGAGAVAALLRHGRPGYRPLGAFMALPGVRGVAEAVYRWVARNRHTLPGGSAACVVPRIRGEGPGERA